MLGRCSWLEVHFPPHPDSGAENPFIWFCCPYVIGICIPLEKGKDSVEGQNSFLKVFVQSDHIRDLGKNPVVFQVFWSFGLSVLDGV